MYALSSRARLQRHEKTYKRAVVHAAQSNRDAELLALATCGAVCWLSEVPPGTAVSVRGALAGLTPDRWDKISRELKIAAEDAAGRRNTAHQLAFALFAGIIESRVIELSHPSLAAQAAAYREQALTLAEQLTSTALDLIGPEIDAGSADTDELAFVPPTRPTAQAVAGA
jgi:hypothetical protein